MIQRLSKFKAGQFPEDEEHFKMYSCSDLTDPSSLSFTYTKAANSASNISNQRFATRIKAAAVLAT